MTPPVQDELLPTPEGKSLTERELLQRLQTKYSSGGMNGPGFVLASHVKSGAGHYRGNQLTGKLEQHRTIDAYLMALTVGKKLELTAFEIKSSRSDWLRELADPTKAEAFTDKVDRFVLVTGHPAIVKDGELPEKWGLMIPHGAGLKLKRRPRQLYDRPASRSSWSPDLSLPPGFDRSFLAALLRAVAKGH